MLHLACAALAARVAVVQIGSTWTAHAESDVRVQLRACGKINRDFL
jgi:hypothetical protein